MSENFILKLMINSGSILIQFLKYKLNILPAVPHKILNLKHNE